MFSTPKFWYEFDIKSYILSRILFPLSLIWIFVDKIRILLANPYRSKITIICVGNLNIGGTGKTPLVEYLISILPKSKIALLSRGYKRRSNGFLFAQQNHSAKELGDEINQVSNGQWMPIISLLRYLKINPENPKIINPYIFSTDELINNWSNIFQHEDRPIIGINWQGDPNSEKGSQKGRSFPLETFSTLAQNNNFKFLSLQKGFGSEQLEYCSFKNTKVDVMIQANTGPEIVTGSTRMKAGTATKLILNMISTTTMIKLGKVYGNLMIDLKTVNKKLIDRGIRIISETTGLQYNRAKERLISAENSVKSAIVMEEFKCNLEEAKIMLKNVDGFLHRLIKNK